MNKNSRLFAVLSYFTWVGFLISFFLRDKDDTLVRRHLNQSLVIHVVETIGGILIGWGGFFGNVGSIINLACLILFFLGVYRAIKMSEEPLPIAGEFNLIN